MVVEDETSCIEALFFYENNNEVDVLTFIELFNHT